MVYKTFCSSATLFPLYFLFYSLLMEYFCHFFSVQILFVSQFVIVYLTLSLYPCWCDTVRFINYTVGAFRTLHVNTHSFQKRSPPTTKNRVVFLFFPHFGGNSRAEVRFPHFTVERELIVTDVLLLGQISPVWCCDVVWVAAL